MCTLYTICLTIYYSKLFQVVSESLQKSDFKSLEGLVDKDAIVTLKDAVSKLSVSQRQMLSISKEDIFYAFPYQVIYLKIDNSLTCCNKEVVFTFENFFADILVSTIKTLRFSTTIAK